MAVMNMVKALNSALDNKLGDDNDVIIFGEDAGKEGGVFRVTQGLQEKYGDKRVFDTPLAESVLVGAGLGMAMAGLRPVIELQFSGFFYPAFDQLISHISRMRHRTRGNYTAPMVMRMPYGGMVKALESHSESMEGIYGHIPGLKVVIPSTPYDAKGLLISAIEANDPVVFMEPKRSYRAIKQEVPDDIYRIKIGKARIVQEGEHITAVGYGAMMKMLQQATMQLKKEGVSVELIDLRTIYPLDIDTVTESVKKTGRLFITHEGPNSFGVAAEIMALANEESFLYLEAPPTRLTGFDTIVPLPRGEDLYYPSADRMYYEMKKIAEF
jgi:pyruvate dehydrogenase E1 component beta subunit